MAGLANGTLADHGRGERQRYIIVAVGGGNYTGVYTAFVLRISEILCMILFAAAKFVR